MGPSDMEKDFNTSTALHDALLLPDCVKAVETPSHCNSAHVFAPHVQTPIFVAQNQFDEHQLSMLDLSSAATGAHDGQAFMRYFGRAMRKSVMRLIQNRDNGLFLPACYDYLSKLWHPTEPTPINGNSWHDVLVDWFFEQNQMSHILMDNCGELP